MCRPATDHDASGKSLLRKKVVQQGEDGEVRREAGGLRIPATVASSLNGTVLHLVLAQ